MYIWPGMLKISKDDALKLYDEKEIYLLYDDDTESRAESIDEIINHQGEFGIEINETKPYVETE